MFFFLNFRVFFLTSRAFLGHLKTSEYFFLTFSILFCHVPILRIFFVNFKLSNQNLSSKTLIETSFNISHNTKCVLWVIPTQV